ncbi:hypothetical protein ABPG72_005317 [Tetrahymena utriculariae]
MHPFAKLGLESWIQKTCDKVGYQNPTKIQELAIPPLLKKQHVIANAETGSGKTATFAFPILQDLANDPYGVFAIVLTANRELAMQISEQFTIFGSSLNLRVSTLVGGVDFNKQLTELERIPHIVVGTPGRTLDMIDKSPVLKEYIENVKYLVLDEADRLFEDSIIEDVQAILEFIPQEKQIILATATINDDFNDKKLNQILKTNVKFERFCVNQQKKVVQTLKQKFILVPEMVKDQNFINLLNKFKGISMIIFVNKCRTCHFINALLNQLEFASTSLHSGLKQSQRISHLKTFKSQSANILVATDVASRGLDIPTVDLVINYDIPKNSDDYIHRVGRTARKGKRGLAISIMTQYDVQLILNIEKNICEKLEELKVDEEEALGIAPKINKAKKLVKIKMSEDGSSEAFDKQEQDKKSYKEFIREQKKQKKLENKQIEEEEQ